MPTGLLLVGALVLAVFCNYAEKLGAPVVEAEGKNKNMITDKWNENENNLRKWFQRLDYSLSNAVSFQASNQAHSCQAIFMKILFCQNENTWPFK